MCQLECGVLPPLQYSAALCLWLPQFWNFLVNFLCDMPSSIGAYPDLLLCNGTKTSYFWHLFCAFDWPTIANMDPSSFATCIAAFKSWSFYTHAYAYVVASWPKSKHCFLQVNIGILKISFIKAIYIVCHCVFLNPVTKSLVGLNE